MSSIDLVLLGFVMRKPISAYDLAKFVESYDLQDIVKLSTPAIYKNLKNLEKKGYLSSESQKSREMPEKTIYSVIDKGRKYFYDLMEKYSHERIRYEFNFNAVVVNLDKLPRGRGRKIAQRLKSRLEKSKTEVKQYLKALERVSPMGKMLFKQINMVNNALLTWIDDLLKTLYY